MASKLETDAARKPPNAGKGRKAGVPNKTTAQLKDAILNAFNKAGGEDYLKRVADSDPKTFCTLLGKVLPMQVNANMEGGLTVVIKRFGNQPSE